MPSLQVQVPEELYLQVIARGLPTAELVERALRAELPRQDLLAATDIYLAELVAEVGEPTAEDDAYAEDIARQMSGRYHSRTG